MLTAFAVSDFEDVQEHILDPRERSIAQRVAQGLPDRAIAQRLGLTENEVKEQLVVIFRKLAVAGLLDQLIYTGDNSV